jgi:hypothetical protein
MTSRALPSIDGYSEYRVHQQQVRDGVGHPGANSDETTGPVVDTFLRALPYALRHAASVPGTCAEIRVTRTRWRDLDGRPARRRG